MVASAFAMFAELLVWLAEPARSFGPHFEGAQFSVSGLSDTGPFSVCVSAGTARPSRSAMATNNVARTMANFMETLLSGDREQRATSGHHDARARRAAEGRRGSGAQEPSRFLARPRPDARLALARTHQRVKAPADRSEHRSARCVSPSRLLSDRDRRTWEMPNSDGTR